jgi:PAS domain S-box-containing protein
VALTGESCRTDEVSQQEARAGTSLATRVLDTIIVPVGENLVVSARDVTERRRSEEELRLRAELLDLAHDAVIVRDPAESRVTFWNREAQAIYGYSPAEALDRVLHDLLATVFPESKQAVADALAREGRWVGELRHTRKDGTVIVVSSRQALQRGADGQPSAIIELNSDITERKRVEEELAHIAGLLERTEAVSRTGGWEYDVATGELTWTDEVYRIYGVERTSDPAEVSQAIEAYDPESAPVIDAAFQRLVAEGVPYDLELGLIRADGQRVWVRTIGRPVLDDGRVVRVGGNISDVTERKLAEAEVLRLNTELERRVLQRTAELRAANQELEGFAYSLAHDLRAPVRAINGFGAALSQSHGDELGDRGRETLDRIRRASAKMGELIDAMLLLSELTRRELSITSVDLSAATREIGEQLRARDPSRQVEFVIEDGLETVGDRRLVRVLMCELLENAWRFTGPREHARIEVMRAGRGVFAVRDNGVGFNMDFAGLLFEPFARLHREDEFPGTGIGLTTVERIVRRHGGGVWGEGRLGEGATFYFRLEPATEAG